MVNAQAIPATLGEWGSQRPYPVEYLGTTLHTAITAMLEANDYGMAISDEVAASMRYQSDWMLGIKRIQSAVSPQDVIDAQLLRQVDPKLVTWNGK